MRCYRLLLLIAVFGIASLIFSMWSTHAVVSEMEAAVAAMQIDVQREHVVHQWALLQYVVSGISILVLFGLVIRAYLVMEADLRAARPAPSSKPDPKHELHKAA